MRAMRKAVTGAISPLVVASLSACSSAGAFEKDDPEAHNACTKFLVDPVMKDLPEDDELAIVLGTVLIVGEHAAKATTPEVLAAAEPMTGLDQWLIDDVALIQARSDAGYVVDEDSVAAYYLAQN